MLPTYSTGTASVAAGGTVVTGTGGMWTGINVKQGDFISIGGSDSVLITEVTDTTHLKVSPWPDAAKTSQPYIIYQNYVGRVVGVAAAEDVGVMLEKLHTDGLPFIVDASATEPDPSYGDEGQLAFQPTTGNWWSKSGGVWISIAGLTALGYGGTSSTPVTIGMGSKSFTTQANLAYNGARVRAASASNQNNYMIGPAVYSGTTLTILVDQIGGSGTFADWLFSVAGVGPVGPVGPAGPVGPTGPVGTGAGNVNGPAGAVADRIAVYNGTTGTVIKDGGKTVAELIASSSIISTTSTPPTGAVDGDMWFEDDTGSIFIYYDDGTSSQWVMVGGSNYDPQLFSNIPQVSQSANYTTIITDAQKHIFHPSADTTARTFTIAANASVAYPIGTSITFVNQNAAGVITIAITSDTMRLAGVGTTGNRTLAANGVCTALKVTATEWIISGAGLT